MKGYFISSKFVESKLLIFVKLADWYSPEKDHHQIHLIEVQGWGAMAAMRHHILVGFVGHDNRRKKPLLSTFDLKASPFAGTSGVYDYFS